MLAATYKYFYYSYVIPASRYTSVLIMLCFHACFLFFLLCLPQHINAAYIIALYSIELRAQDTTNPTGSHVEPRRVGSDETAHSRGIYYIQKGGIKNTIL